MSFTWYRRIFSHVFTDVLKWLLARLPKIPCVLQLLRFLSHTPVKMMPSAVQTLTTCFYSMWCRLGKRGNGRGEEWQDGKWAGLTSVNFVRDNTCDGEVTKRGAN